MTDGLHIAMVPWLAFGHLIPFFQLSVALAKVGFRVSYLSTPKNLQRLPKAPPNLTAQITLVELPLPQVDGLQEGAEATVDLDDPNDEYLKKAYDLLHQPFERFVEESSPDWIIHDLLAPWTAQIARRFGVPVIVFSIYSAGPIAFFGLTEFVKEEEALKEWTTPESLVGPPRWIQFPSSVAFRIHEAKLIWRWVFKPNASGISDCGRILRAVKGCDALVLRSCEEYEGEYLDVLRHGKHFQKPVIPIGLLPLPPPEKRTSSEDGEWGKIFRWLDGKAAGSVVFVGFGSECKLSRQEVYEIAHGLELSNLPFLWALRQPAWAANELDSLPIGFATRIGSRGLVHVGWAPQSEILAHPAIGGSLFHSGWGSIIENVQWGHVLVALPFANVQGLDARLAVDKGLAIEVDRNDDGSFHRDAIAAALRRAMVDEEGEGLRVRSREMMAVFGDHQLHGHYLERFVDFLNGHKKGKMEK